jgi:hypothetical protein
MTRETERDTQSHRERYTEDSLTQRDVYTDRSLYRRKGAGEVHQSRLRRAGGKPSKVSVSSLSRHRKTVDTASMYDERSRHKDHGGNRKEPFSCFMLARIALLLRCIVHEN